MSRAQFVISFLEQENKQLKYKQVLMELELLKEKIQDTKCKEMMSLYYLTMMTLKPVGQYQKQEVLRELYNNKNMR